jgi:hypothetical protein
VSQILEPFSTTSSTKARVACLYGILCSDTERFIRYRRTVNQGKISITAPQPCFNQAITLFHYPTKQQVTEHTATYLHINLLLSLTESTGGHWSVANGHANLYEPVGLCFMRKEDHQIMIKKRTTRMISLTTMVVVVAMLGVYFAMTFAASAAPAPGETYIVQKPGSTTGAYFHPNTLSCTHPCTITIKNTLASSQTITSNGKTSSIGPHLSISISYTKAGNYVFTLGSHQLTVTVS